MKLLLLAAVGFCCAVLVIITNTYLDFTYINTLRLYLNHFSGNITKLRQLLLDQMWRIV